MGTWNYVINEKFAEEYGDGALSEYAGMLGDVAQRVSAGDRAGAREMLDAGFDRLGLDMPDKTRDQLAENLTLAEHSHLVISDSEDRVIAEYPLPGGAVSDSGADADL